MRTFQLPSIGNRFVYQARKTPAKFPPTVYKPPQQRFTYQVQQQLKPLVQTLMPTYNKVGPQFFIGEQIQFTDKRTNEQCNRILESSLPSNLKYYFPNLFRSQRPLLCLDMDLTLVNTRIGCVKPVDISMTLSQGTTKVQYSVLLRPYLQEFLSRMAQLYDLLIFTSAGQLYADNLIDRFDTEKLIGFRIYQQHCTQIIENGVPVFVKDLSKVGQSLDRTILVDDNVRSIQFQQENSVLIRAFDGQKTDQELVKLADRLTRVHDKWRDCGSVIQALQHCK